MIDFEKCRLTHYPADVLRSPACPVEKNDDNVRLLVEKMTDIMLENNGVGLAGPQAGVPLRIFIISLEQNRQNVKVYINPAVTADGDLESFEEGCLSVPGIHTKIRRYKKCTVTAADLEGNEFTEQADGLYARAIQHEFDHIEGITIVNRMSRTAKIMHRKQLKRLAEDQIGIYNNRQ
jgi:peptide deformylase